LVLQGEDVTGVKQQERCRDEGNHCHSKPNDKRDALVVHEIPRLSWLVRVRARPSMKTILGAAVSDIAKFDELVVGWSSSSGSAGHRCSPMTVR
jgi:hypothetical protein